VSEGSASNGRTTPCKQQNQTEIPVRTIEKKAISLEPRITLLGLQTTSLTQMGVFTTGRGGTNFTLGGAQKTQTRRGKCRHSLRDAIKKRPKTRPQGLQKNRDIGETSFQKCQRISKGTGKKKGSRFTRKLTRYRVTSPGGERLQAGGVQNPKEKKLRSEAS